MPAEIVLQITSEFDDSGIRKAITQLNKLIEGATGKSSGKNLKSGLDQATQSAEELSEALEGVNKIKKQVDNATRRLAQSSKQMTEAQQRAAEIQRMTRREQELVQDIMEENADLMNRIRRATQNLTKDTEKRTKAERELRDIAKETQQLQQRRMDLEQRMQSLLDKGNATAAEKRDLQRELNSLQTRYNQLVNQRAAAEAKIRDADDVRRQASAVRAELKNLMDWEDLNGTKQFEQMLRRLDNGLDQVARNGAMKMRQFSTEVDKAGNKIVKFSDAYNRIGNTNLGTLLSRSAAHLDAFGTAFDQTRRKADNFGDELKQVQQQAKITAQQHEAMVRSMSQSESKTFSGRSIMQATRVAQQQAAQATREATAALKAQQAIVRQAQSAWASLQNVLARFAAIVGGVVVRAVMQATNAMSRLMSNGGRFATLRSSLDATGRSFVTFGAQAEMGLGRAERAIDRTMAGWSLLQTGQMWMTASHQMRMNAERALTSYLDFERASTLAAVSTVDPNASWLGNRTPTRFIQELVFGAQRGRFGDPIMTLSSEELAQGVYYYGSAIGQDINPSNADAVMRAIVPIMQVAGFTQTQPETMVKGVLNAAQMFGFDPRDVRNSQNIGRIADLYGFLANATSMEVPDIANFFKMVGPLAKVLSPQGPAGALEEVMAWAYIASDYGLRGSQPARGLQQLLQSVLSPSGPANEAAMKVWGTDMRGKFFDPTTGTLRGGLLGLIEPFLELDQAEWLVAQSDMFTNNASRTIVPLIEEMRKNPERWKEVIQEIEQGDFLERGMTTANNTLSAQLQNLKNAWTEFMSSLMYSSQPEIFGFLGTLAGGLREVADIINELPQLGKVFTGLYAGVTGLLALGGGVLAFAGAMLVLRRGMMLAGSGATVFLTAMRAIPAVLAMSIPVLGAVAAAAIALKVAWDNNFLGIQDTVDQLRTIFSGDFSRKFFEFLDSDRFASIYTWVTRLGSAFKELVSGIFFNTGDTNNLFALMDRVFGPRLGTLINQNLDRLRTTLVDARGAISDFFSDVREGLPSLSTFGNAIKGVFEQLLTGGMSLDGARGINKIGEWLGIDDLQGKVREFSSQFNQGFRTVTGYARAFAGEMASIFRRIGSNIADIFTIDNITSAFRTLMSFATGFGAAVAGAFLLAANAVERLTWALANAGRVGSAINDVIESLTGIRLELDNIAMVAGIVFGTLFASRILMTLTPIRLMVTSLTQLGSIIVTLGVRVALLAAQFAVLAARAVLIGSINVIFRTVSVSIGLMTAAAGLATGTFATLTAIIGGFSATMFGIVGILGVVAVGIYAFVAATQGFDRANALARAFFDGLVSGVSIAIGAIQGLITIIGGVVGALSSIAEWALSLVGIEAGFRNAEDAARSFGVVVGALLATAFLGAVAKMMSGLLSLSMGFMDLGKKGPLVWGVIGIAMLALGPHFDTVIGWVNNLIDALNQLQIAGVGVGDVLAGALLLGGGIGTNKRGRDLLGKVGGGLLTAGRWVAPAMKNPYVLTGLVAAGTGYAIYKGSQTPDAQYQSSVVEPYMNAINLNIGPDGKPVNTLELSRQAGVAFDPLADSYRSMGMSEAWIAERWKSYEQAYVQSRLPSANPENVLAQQQIDYYKEYGYLPDYLPSKKNATPDQIGSGYYVTPQAQAVIATENAGFRASDAVSRVFGVNKYDNAERINYEQDVRNSRQNSDSLIDSLFGHSSIGDYISNLFNISPSDLAKQFGFTSDGGWSVDTLFDANGLGKFRGEFDPRMMEFLPKPFRDYMEQTQNWDLWERTVKTHGVDVAREIFRSNNWKVPTNPNEFGRYLEQVGMTEEEFNQLALEQQQYYEEMKQHEVDLQSAWQQADLPTAMRAVMSGPSFVTPQGNLGRNVSGAEVLMTYADQFLQNFGDTMPWMNQQEILADAAIEGVLTKNLGGVNMHRAMQPLIQRWSQESGLAVEELMKNIPKFFYDEQYMAQATTDLAQFFATVPTNTLSKLDTLGKGKFEEFGLKWQELTQYAISQAMSGNTDWNLADYISQAWDISKADAEAYIRANGLDPNVITGAMFQDTQGMVNSMGGQIVALTTEWWDYFNQVTSSGTDRTIEITQSAFNALPDYVKLAYAQMGYQFVIGGEMSAQQAEANVQMLESRLTSAYGEVFTNIKDEIQRGIEPINTWTDEHGTKWVDILDEATGKTFSIPEVEYEAYKSSLEAAKRETESFADGLRKAFEEGWSRGIKIGAGDGTGGPTSQNWLAGLGSGVGAVTKYAAQHITGNESGMSGGLQMLGLPTPTEVDTYVGDIATTIQTGVSDAFTSAEFKTNIETAITDLDVKVKFGIDFQHFSGEVSNLLVTMNNIATSVDGFKMKFGIDFAYFSGEVSNLLVSMSNITTSVDAFKMKIGIDFAYFSGEVSNLLVSMSSMTTSVDSFKMKIGIDFGYFSEQVSAMLVSLSNVSQVDAFKIKVGVELAENAFESIGTVFENLTFTAKLDGDASPFGTKVGGATTIGNTFAAQVFIATLDGDAGPFGTKVGDATLIGTTFAATTFTATLSADASLFGQRVGGATTIGNTFANTTFTASLDANTSPFWSAVNSISGRSVGTAYIDVVQRGNGTVSNFANGGLVTEPVVMVGENGPELVSLPYGSYVHTYMDSMRMVAEWADTYNVRPRPSSSVSMTPSTLSGVSPAQAQTFTTRPVVIQSSTRASAPEQIVLNFHGPVYMRDENEFKQATKELVAEVKREIARDHQLAERGMTSVPIGRTLG